MSELAWDGGSGIDCMEVSPNGGDTWMRAKQRAVAFAYPFADHGAP